MSPLIKLSGALILLIACLVLVCGVFLNDLSVQVVFFLGLSICLFILRGGKHWLGGFKIMLPFLISLSLIYALFGLLKVRTQEGSAGTIDYWITFGLKRILLFVNSVFAFRAFFATVGFKDFIQLPLRIGFLKYVILGKALYNTSFSSYPDLNLLQKFIPSEQRSRPTFAHRFRCRLASLLALLLTVINEAREKGELIDNRIVHCHNGKAHNTATWYLILGFVVLVTIATMIVPIPIPGGGFFNFGDVMVVFVGLYAGKKAGAIAGGIGSAIADLMLFPLFAPITLVVKGCEGFICGLAYNKKDLLTFIFPLLGCSVIVLGYFLGEWFMPQLGKAVALSDLPANIIQASAGFIGGRALFEAARYLEI